MTTESTAPVKKKLHPQVVATIDRIQDKREDELNNNPFVAKLLVSVASTVNQVDPV